MTTSADIGIHRRRRVWHDLLLVALAAGAFVAVTAYAGLARAQDACLPYDTAAHHLLAKHAEAPSAVGVTGSGQLVQLFRSEAGDTWTLVVVSPDGTACALAEGEGWSELPRLPGRPS